MGLAERRMDQEAIVRDAITKWANADKDGPGIKTVKHQASLVLRGGQVGRTIRRMARRGEVIVTKPRLDTPYGSIVGKRVKLVPV